MNDEIDFLKFVQTEINTEFISLKKYPVPTIRTRVEAPCPGRHSNLVTLVSGPEAQEKILRPKNVGSCSLHVVYYEKNGTFIGHYTLHPNEQWESMIPPPNAWVTKFGCKKDCSGTAILEYDTPYFC